MVSHIETCFFTLSHIITYLVQIKAFLHDQYDRKQTVHIFTPRENNRLLGAPRAPQTK